LQEAAIIIGLLTLIPVGFFVYDRFLKLPHAVSVEHGNVRFARIISKTDQRNEKLALLVYDLKVINTHSNPITIKEILLRYSDGENIKECRPYSIPTGEIEGKQAIAMSNSKDQIVIAWENIWDKVISSNIVPPGGILRGSALFILAMPVDHAHDIKSLSLVVRDFNANESEHISHVQDKWLEAIQNNFSLIDARVKKVGDNIEWEGISISSKKKPA
jgi:hypothetical protein